MTGETTPAEIAEAFLRAWASGDMAGARSSCSDTMHFVGPIEEWHNPDDHLNALKPVAGIVSRVDVKKTIAHGDDVAIIYDLVTDTPVGNARIAEWTTIQNGKIVEIRAFFDSYPWRSAGFGAQQSHE